MTKHAEYDVYKEGEKLGRYLTITERRDGSSVWYVESNGMLGHQEHFNVVLRRLA